jgi:CDP-diacylglycerol--glycerol-3-phosphate 3-phosphatidyltransferase
MVTIYSIKPYFQALLRPLLKGLVWLRVTPNQVTLFAAFLSIGFGIYFTWVGRDGWWLLPFVLLFRMALNAIDGMLAKQFQMQSRLGVYLNELGDVVSDLFLFLPFMIEFPFSMGLISVLSVLSEIAGILAVAVGATRRYDGPMGKSDRACFLGIIGFFLYLGLLPDSWAVLLFTMISALLCLTVFFRIRRALYP